MQNKRRSLVSLLLFFLPFFHGRTVHWYVPKQLTIGVKFHTVRSKLASRSNFQEISGNRDDVFSEQYVNRILLYKISTISYVHIVFYLIDIFQLFPLIPMSPLCSISSALQKGVDKNRSSWCSIERCPSSD